MGPVAGLLLVVGLAFPTAAFVPRLRPQGTVRTSSSPAGARHFGQSLIQCQAVTAPVSEDLDAWVQRYQESTKQEGEELEALTIDRAGSIPEVLAAIFDQVVKAQREGMGPKVLLFPKAKQLFEPAVMTQLRDHLDLCKECCEYLGQSQNTRCLAAGSEAPVPAVEIRPIQQSNEVFGDDPYWDDDDDSPPLGLDFGEDGANDEEEKLYHVPDSDAELIEATRAWVAAVIADLGVCPFTVDEERAGLPVGKVRYEITREAVPDAIYATYWSEVALVSGGESAKNEKELSTTLLITPNFGLRNREFYETFSNTLTQPLEAMGLEDDIQLVFFHPDWVFRDGANRIGDDGAANYARRSPWPMINILRTPQVRKAQKAIPTGLVYRQNEVTLAKIGSDRLQKWLVDRDWSDVKDNFRVDRRSIPVLSTAQDLLQGKSTTPLSDDDLEVAAQRAAIAQTEGLRGATTGAAGGRETVIPMDGPIDDAMDADDDDAWTPSQEDDDDDDWDKPFDSRAALDLGDDMPRRPMEEIAADSRGVIQLIRKRLNSNQPLSPVDIRELEELVNRLRS